MVLSPIVSTALRVLALIVLALVVGSMFGIWRGYDLAQYSTTAFLEVHQGAVRGLNTLLPAMGFAALASVAALAFMARTRPTVLWTYIAAGAFIAIAALVTRLGNQPINDEVMQWSAAALPENWQSIRDTWSMWHLVRLASGLAALVLLTLAILGDRTD